MRHWTPAERELVASLYPYGQTYRQIARVLDAQPKQVNNLIKNIYGGMYTGKPRMPKPHRYFTPDENERLVKLWGSLTPVAEIARELGVTVRQVHNRVQHMKRYNQIQPRFMPRGRPLLCRELKLTSC